MEVSETGLVSNRSCSVVLYLQLFNVLFDESYNLKLSTDEGLEKKVGNWNKINAVICFNYFQ